MITVTKGQWFPLTIGNISYDGAAFDLQGATEVSASLVSTLGVKSPLNFEISAFNDISAVCDGSLSAGKYGIEVSCKGSDGKSYRMKSPGAIIEVSSSTTSSTGSTSVKVAGDEWELTADVEMHEGQARTYMSLLEEARKAAIKAADDAEAVIDNVQSSVTQAQEAAKTAQQASTNAEDAVTKANNAVSDANNALQSITTMEGTVSSAEQGRKDAESERVTAEQGRKDAESERVTAEQARVTAETARVKAEQGRVTAEQGRVTAEDARKTAESARETAENSRDTAEAKRASAETERQKAEDARKAAEQERESTLLAGKEDVTTIVAPVNTTDATLSITTLTTEVGKYYRLDATVETLTVTLPAITDLTTVRTVVIYLTAGTTPAVTIISADSKDVYFQDGFEIEAGKTYEVNCLWNGSAWIVASVEIVVTNNGGE